MIKDKEGVAALKLCYMLLELETFVQEIEVQVSDLHSGSEQTLLLKKLTSQKYSLFAVL